MTHPERNGGAELLDRLIACVPSNWLDPLLTGNNSVKPYDSDKYNSRQIEELFNRIRERMKVVAREAEGERGECLCPQHGNWLHADDIVAQVKKNARDTGPKGAEAVDPNADGEAFERWARSEQYDMTTHPLHWLFLNERTYAARQRWKAAREFYAPSAVEELPSAAVDCLWVQAITECVSWHGAEPIIKRARELGAIPADLAQGLIAAKATPTAPVHAQAVTAMLREKIQHHVLTAHLYMEAVETSGKVFPKTESDYYEANRELEVAIARVEAALAAPPVETQAVTGCNKMMKEILNKQRKRRRL